MLASTGDDLPLKGLVCRHTVTRAEGRVATSLGVATGNADSRAFTTNDLQTLGIRGRVCLASKDTGTHLDSLALVVLIIPVLELDVLKVVHPETESTSASALAIVVVASVTDGETNVAVVHKLDAGRHIGGRRDVDAVLDVSTQHTLSGPLGERVTALVGEEWSHDGGRVRVATSVS